MTEHVCDKVRWHIEAMVDDDAVLHGHYAKTPWFKPYTVIANGVIKAQGEIMPPVLDLDVMVAMTIERAAELRAAIEGEAVLIWRAVPHIEDENLYLRLCFERLWNG